MDFNGVLKEFVHLNISPFGVTGLSWGDLDSNDWFGRKVTVHVQLLIGGGLRFKTQAYVLRESTAVAEHFGLKFELGDEEGKKLQEFVRAQGTYPTEYLRKYPRIPATKQITTFPVHAAVRREGKYQTFVLDIKNLSPNGILLSSENPMALRIVPGERLELTIDPRGWFPFQIKVQALVCRIVDEKLGDNQNIYRLIGMRFLKVEEPHRTAFLDLLRDILSQMKDQR